MFFLRSSRMLFLRSLLSARSRVENLMLWFAASRIGLSAARVFGVLAAAKGSRYAFSPEKPHTKRPAGKA